MGVNQVRELTSAYLGLEMPFGASFGWSVEAILKMSARLLVEVRKEEKTGCWVLRNIEGIQ